MTPTVTVPKRSSWAGFVPHVDFLFGPFRFALVAYRDQGDDYITQVSKFTGNVDKFQRVLNKLEADGGGDELALLAVQAVVGADLLGLQQHRTDLAAALKTPNLDLSGIEDRAMLGGIGRCPASPLPVTDIDQIEAMTLACVAPSNARRPVAIS